MKEVGIVITEQVEYCEENNENYYLIVEISFDKKVKLLLE